MRFQTLTNNLKTAQQWMIALGVICALLLLSTVLLTVLAIRLSNQASVYRFSEKEFGIVTTLT